MSINENLQIAILNQSESLLGYLNPDIVSIEEHNKLKEFRSIHLKHPLFDHNTSRLGSTAEILIHGNKIWRQKTADGNSCLYVIIDDREVDTNGNEITIKAYEVAVELSMLPPQRFITPSPVTVTTEFIETLVRNLFTPGSIISGQTFTYSGTIGAMGLLREIEKQTGHEFHFRYEYNTLTQKIDRFIDFVEKSGKTHNIPIEVGYNTENIILEENESDVGIGAAPIGSAGDSKAETVNNFHQARKLFEDLVVNTSTQIPLWVTKDEDGNEVNGPLTYPPYSKEAGQTYVVSDGSGSSANYKVVTTKTGTIPRMILFESSEENKYNLYWLCVGKIKEKQHPAVSIDIDVVDIMKIKEDIYTLYNVGDSVPVQMPGRKEIVFARIIETTKDPREISKHKITIGNYQIDFFSDYLGASSSNEEAFITL